MNGKTLVITTVVISTLTSLTWAQLARQRAKPFFGSDVKKEGNSQRSNFGNDFDSAGFGQGFNSDFGSRVSRQSGRARVGRQRGLRSKTESEDFDFGSSDFDSIDVSKIASRPVERSSDLVARQREQKSRRLRLRRQGQQSKQKTASQSFSPVEYNYKPVVSKTQKVEKKSDELERKQDYRYVSGPAEPPSHLGGGFHFKPLAQQPGHNDIQKAVFAGANAFKADGVYQTEDRLQFQIHGQQGPHSYRYGYDTGNGYNRQFRYEERDDNGYVKGRYGFFDRYGKLHVINYTADPHKGFHAEGPRVPEYPH